MSRKLLLFGISGTALFLAVWLYCYFALDKRGLPYSNGSEGVATSTVFVVEDVVAGLEVPWSIVWTAQDRMLVSERPGRVRAVIRGTLQEKPLHLFIEVSAGGEEGLMSLAVDPHYASNKHLYACLAYETGGRMFAKIVRFFDAGSSFTDEKVILDAIPAAQFHAGCRIAFGPDGMLYASTGDATMGALAQDLSSLAGKILRMNPDGSVPSDNPFPGSLIWSYGHRNPQGIAWHPKTGEMYETEHGPSLFDGPAGGDEVNLIQKGANYGWPLVSHDKKKEGTVAPIAVFTPAEAPGSALFYSGSALPQFRDGFFFGALKGEGLVRMLFDEKDPTKVLSLEKLSDVRFGRIRDVAQGPDGFIYFSTSNRDGRGDPALSDDRIFRIRPADGI